MIFLWIVSSYYVRSISDGCRVVAENSERSCAQSMNKTEDQAQLK